ncbi:MAG: hypothetical protein ACOYI6_11650 [Christensenellales bacterium]
MKKIILGGLLAATLLISGPLVVLAKGQTPEELNQRFENLKIMCIQMELDENGIVFNKTQPLDNLLSTVDKLSDSGRIDKKVKQTIDTL